MTTFLLKHTWNPCGALTANQSRRSCTIGAAFYWQLGNWYTNRKHPWCKWTIVRDSFTEIYNFNILPIERTICITIVIWNYNYHRYWPLTTNSDTSRCTDNCSSHCSPHTEGYQICTHSFVITYVGSLFKIILTHKMNRFHQKCVCACVRACVCVCQTGLLLSGPDIYMRFIIKFSWH